jgi:hypothetical protein
MGLLGGIIGGIGSAVAGIVGSNASRKAANRNARLLQEAEDESKAWYDKEYNSNFLDRSDARAAIARTRDILNERYKAAEGAAAITGATAESVAQQKAAANQALADVTGTIAERADAHKEAVRANYEAQQNSFMQQKMGVNNQKAQAATTAASGLANAANSFGEAVDGVFGKRVDAWAEGLFKKKGE